MLYILGSKWSSKFSNKFKKSWYRIRIEKSALNSQNRLKIRVIARLARNWALLMKFQFANECLIFESIWIFLSQKKNKI